MFTASQQRYHHLQRWTSGEQIKKPQNLQNLVFTWPSQELTYPKGRQFLQISGILKNDLYVQHTEKIQFIYYFVTPVMKIINYYISLWHKKCKNLDTKSNCPVSK